MRKTYGILLLSLSLSLQADKLYPVFYSIFFVIVSIGDWYICGRVC